MKWGVVCVQVYLAVGRQVSVAVRRSPSSQRGCCCLPKLRQTKGHCHWFPANGKSFNTEHRMTRPTWEKLTYLFLALRTDCTTNTGDKVPSRGKVAIKNIYDVRSRKDVN